MEPAGNMAERYTPITESDIYFAFISIYCLAGYLNKGQRLFDSGCGTGFGDKYLLAGQNATLTAIDLDPVAIEYANTYFQQPNIEFRVGDCTDLAFEDATFDLVFSSNVIEHVPDYQKAIDEAARVLKPEGIYLLATPPDTVEAHSNPYHCSVFPAAHWQNCLAKNFKYIRAYNHRAHHPATSFERSTPPDLQEMLATARNLGVEKYLEKFVNRKSNNPLSLNESNYYFEETTAAELDNPGITITTVLIASNSPLPEFQYFCPAPDKAELLRREQAIRLETEEVLFELIKLVIPDKQAQLETRRETASLREAVTWLGEAVTSLSEGVTFLNQKLQEQATITEANRRLIRAYYNSWIKRPFKLVKKLTSRLPVRSHSK